LIEEFLKPAILAGIITFVILYGFTLGMIIKFKPSLIKTAAIQRKKLDRPSTLQWTTILLVFIATAAVGVGVSVLANVIIFVLWGEWTFEPWTIIGLAVAFGYVIFREYDVFITGLFKK
jgi:FtsH-binding integral membrane protein